MFSLNHFYNVLHANLVNPLSVDTASVYFTPFGTYDNKTIKTGNNFDIPGSIDHTATFHFNRFPLPKQSLLHCYFFDQEPFYEQTKTIADKSRLIQFVDDYTGASRFMVFATSEKSSLVSDYAKDNNYYVWYYFYHGFAALDWYRDFQYVNPSSFNRFDKVFICYNHLISNLRSYRLHLVSNLIDQDLVKYGLVSLFLKDNLGTWKDAVDDPHSNLDPRAKSIIQDTLANVNEPLIIDTATPTGSLSAQVDLDQLTSALWHVVTETVYFSPKLHLTEKIFKPIVAQRPFILVAAPGNLAYLKSYGFRTFDRWIDESYDLEQDHYIRIEKITAEIARLCTLSKEQLEQMHQEMQEVLTYNFNHFYSEFKNVIVNELVDNFSSVLDRINHGRIPGNHSRFHQRVELNPEYLAEVKTRLAR